MKSMALLGRCLLLFCILCTIALGGCTADEGGYTLVSTDEVLRPDAAEQITVTDRSYIEVTTEATTARTEPPEVVVTGTSAPAVTTKPPVTEAPRESYTVKFVDSDGAVNVTAVAPITFDPFNNTYVKLGDTVADAFSVGKTLM